MKLKKVLVHASLALGAVIVLSCAVAGCGKRKGDTRPEVYPAEGHSYMKDPAFRQELARQDEKRKKILGERERIFEEFAAVEKRAGSRAAAEKLPEWKALEARAQACGREYEASRREATELFRERVKRANEDSARVARGEARAKEISK